MLRAAATALVRRDHAPARCEMQRQRFEVAAVARQTVQAQYRPALARTGLVAVVQAQPVAGAETLFFVRTHVDDLAASKQARTG
jgi:hypothetical protein